MTNALRIGGLYFAVVFAVGFVLGTVRTLWVTPQLGARTAELIETPIMLLVIAIAAHWLVRRYRYITASGVWLAAGLIGLALMLLVEFTLVLNLRGLSLAGYFATRDPIASAVYLVALGVFAILPLLLSRRTRDRTHSPP